MNNKKTILLGLFAASISQLSEGKIVENEELNLLINDLAKYTNINNFEELNLEVEELLKFINIHQIYDFVAELNCGIKRYLNQKNIKSIAFIYGDINSDNETKKVVELENNQQGIIDDAVIKVELSQDDLLLDFDNQFASFEDTLSKFNFQEKESLDDLLDKLADFSNMDSTTKVDDEVIVQIAQEVENEKENIELNRMVDEYVDEMIEKVTLSQLEIEQDIIHQISLEYPHLTKLFIKEYFSLKESIAEEYPLNTEAIILHRLVFNDLYKLQAFVDVINNQEYYVNVDETKLIVDSFKKIVITDGKILSEIFKVADIASSLDGHYEGYLVK